MRRLLVVSVLCLLFTLSARADSLLSNMQVCTDANNGCNYIPMSTVPTITTRDLLQDPSLSQAFFLFSNFQVFSVPMGQTWTLNVTMSWGNTSITQKIPFSGNNRLLSFSVGISNQIVFPYTPTPFTLNLVMTDASGAVIDSVTDNFNLVTPVPEPSALLMLGSGIVGVGWLTGRRWLDRLRSRA